MPIHLTRTSVSLLACLCLLVLTARPARAAYELTADSKPQEGVPEGKVTKHRWTTSKVFPGTERDYWVYVPAQYDGKTPACVMVFQDGEGFVNREGGYRAAT